ncbi:MAG: hypothetical protein ACOVNL_11390 [Prochlorococcaceae cyanobacterium]|jgi:hypothetical protein
MAERGRAPLPAPYESPWQLLGRDLRALAASARLKVLELRRRNASGELPLPARWPRSLAPLFWPLVLAALLAVVVLLVSRVVIPRVDTPDATPPEAQTQARNQGSGTSAMPAEGTTDTKTALDLLPSEESPESTEGLDPAGEAPEARQAPEAKEAEEVQPLELPAEPSTASAAAPAADPAAVLAAAYAADIQAIDGDQVPDGPWLEAEPDPARAGLRLRLGAPYAELPQPSREQLAALWWERAQAEGYERLELVDRQSRRLGQSARLGSGMILLDPDLLP